MSLGAVAIRGLVIAALKVICNGDDHWCQLRGCGFGGLMPWHWQCVLVRLGRVCVASTLWLLVLCFFGCLRACALRASFRDDLHAVFYPTCVDWKASTDVLDVKLDRDDGKEQSCGNARSKLYLLCTIGHILSERMYFRWQCQSTILQLNTCLAIFGGLM